MKTRQCTLAGIVLFGTTAYAFADIKLSAPHNPVMNTQRTEVVRSCIDAVKDHWDGAGLVLKQQARHGYTVDGTRVIDVRGTVWQDGQRVEVFHQCSQQSGSNQLALYVESDRLHVG